jgi:hypothetical protein
VPVEVIVLRKKINLVKNRLIGILIFIFSTQLGVLIMHIVHHAVPSEAPKPGHSPFERFDPPGRRVNFHQNHLFGDLTVGNHGFFPLIALEQQTFRYPLLSNDISTMDRSMVARFDNPHFLMTYASCCSDLFASLLFRAERLR